MGFIFECLLDIFLDNRSIATIHSIFKLSNLIYQKKRRSIDLNTLENDEEISEQIIKQNRFEKVYLINRIRNHVIWKQLEFWKSFLILQIYQVCNEKKQIKIEQEDVEALVQKNMNIQIFDQMAFVSQQMLFFDVNKEDVKKIMARFAKLIQVIWLEYFRSAISSRKCC